MTEEVELDVVLIPVEREKTGPASDTFYTKPGMECEMLYESWDIVN